MFEKLLANLPYNPGLVKQIGFYARRMRYEESIRRTGLVFIVLAFLVQFVAFIAPPQSSTAYSSSDMINGGIGSKTDAVRACRKNIKNYGDALWNFHITCDNVADSTTTTILSTDHNRDLFSLSWLPYGPTNPNSGKPTYEQALNLAKVSETIYARRLDSADHRYPVSKYTVLKGTSSTGKTFWIMYGCGNLLFVGVPAPAPTCRYNGTVYYAGSKQCSPPACQYNASIAADNPSCAAACPYNGSLLKSDARCAACPYDSSLPGDSPQCKPCSESLSSVDAVACIVEHKTAANLTQHLSNADNTTAQPGDTITYTLSAKNTGKAAVKDFVVQENLSDVLDYADITSLNGGAQHDAGLISWAATTIEAGATVTHTITVQVKNPLPANTPPIGDPNHFDHIMTNVYGNAVNINLPQPSGAAPVISVTTNQALPNTGPGTGLVLAAAIAIVAGYFFARARQLVDESVLVIQHSNGGTL